MADDVVARCRGLLAVFALREATLERSAGQFDQTPDPSVAEQQAAMHLRSQRDTVAWARGLLEDALGDQADPPAEQTTGERWQDVARCVATGVHQIDAAHLFADCPVVKVVGELTVTLDQTSRDTGGSLFDLPLEQRYHLGMGSWPASDAPTDQAPGEQP